MKNYNATPKRRLAGKERQYKKNKYVKKNGDVYDQSGENNPHWKGGISKDNIRYRRKFVENNPEIIKVQTITAKAIRNGELIKEPCEVCGSIKSEPHHDDYSKPLSVRWLCRKHHIKANNERRRKQNREHKSELV